MPNARSTWSGGSLGGFPPEVGEDFLQALDDDLFPLGELVGREFQGERLVVGCVPQVVQESGERQYAVPGEQVLAAVAVIGEVDVPDPAAVVEKVEVVDEVGPPRPHVCAVKGEVK